MSRPALLTAYGLATRALLPILSRREMRKVTDHGFPPPRAAEKLGHASVARPKGPLLWVHAASVGESVSVLALVGEVLRQHPDMHILLTSGTPTSAELIDQRKPSRVLHQFAPLDAPGPVNRFLKHWAPDAAIFVESEIWPNILMSCLRINLPLGLVNARLSRKSLDAWEKRPATARHLLSAFRFIAAQTDEVTEALGRLAPASVAISRGPDLKAMAAPLPVNPDTLNRLQDQLGARPVWMAASTHPGEEEIALKVHASLMNTYPDLMLILAPRHPKRTREVSTAAADMGLSLVQHSSGDKLEGNVYLVDTLGELGTFFAMTPIVFLGGSLVDMGGHNPYEPAQFGVAVLSGPHFANATQAYDALQRAGAAQIVPDSAGLATALRSFLSDPLALNRLQNAAKTYSTAQSGNLSEFADTILATLSVGGGEHA